MYEVHIDSLPKDFDKVLFIKENFENLDFCFYYSSMFFNTKILRDFIEAICNKLKLSKKWKSKLILVADELNNNAIEYWSQKWEMNYMRVKIIKKDSNLDFIIEIKDTWNGSRHRTSKEMRELQENKLKKSFIGCRNSIRWRWLLIVQKLVDKLYFKDYPSGWLIVWIEKKFHI